MNATPEPTPVCRGVVPDGPGCTTAPPVPDPATVEGSGVGGLLGTVVDVLPWVLVAVLGALVVVLLVDRARRRTSAAPRPSPTPTPTDPGPRAPVVTPVPPAPAAPVIDRVVVEELITLSDLASGPAVSAQVRRVLRALGVEPIVPVEGDLLDLDRHEVVATSPTSDPGARDRVVRVHRAGWRTGDVLLRPAAVEVWAMHPSPPHTPR